MFRKTFKQLKYLLIIVVILACFPRSILPHQTSVIEKDDLENYIRLNENELKLMEYKDSEDALKLKLIQLGVINTNRKKFRADPVKLDILASRVANKMCREAGENKFVGHWNMAGEKPYQRYAFAGGNDHVSENAFGEWSSDNYNVSNSLISSLMKKGHNSFMSERAPANGHKQNIIDKFHNYVGIGFYLSGIQFRYYEEFIDRYFEFENIPAEVKPGEPFSITLKTNGNDFLYYMIVYRENFPEELKPARIMKKGSYDDFSTEQYLSIPAWDLARYRSGITYKIPLMFSKEGLYYIHIFSDKKEILKPGSLNTKGKSPASGIVIRANK